MSTSAVPRPGLFNYLVGRSANAGQKKARQLRGDGVAGIHPGGRSTQVEGQADEDNQDGGHCQQQVAEFVQQASGFSVGGGVHPGSPHNQGQLDGGELRRVPARDPFGGVTLCISVYPGFRRHRKDFELKTST